MAADRQGGTGPTVYSQAGRSFLDAPNCSFDYAAVARIRRQERCHCGLTNNVHTSDHGPTAPVGRGNGLASARAGRRPRWGLPTAACPATHYLTSVYPRLHRERLKRGDVLFHCSRSGAFGDFVRSIPEALAISILLDRAFVLQCDTVTKDEGVKIEWPLHLPLYFTGPHFDWRYREQLAREMERSRKNQSNPDLHVTVIDTVVSVSEYRSLNLTTLRKSVVGAVRVVTNAKSTAAAKALQKSPDAAAERFGPLARLNPVQLNGCLLRYLLGPSKHLTRLVLGAVPFLSERVVATDTILPVATMHVRLGDSVWARNSPLSRTGKPGFALGRPWRYSLEKRQNIFWKRPLHAMQCLMRASTREALESHLSPGCLACVVVGDGTEAIEQCARAALERPLFTGGVAMHPLVAGRYGFFAGRNPLNRRLANEKTVLDWWLLTRTHTLVTLGTSAFSSTAIWLREAGNHHGYHIGAHNISRILSLGASRECSTADEPAAKSRGAGVMRRLSSAMSRLSSAMDVGQRVGLSGRRLMTHAISTLERGGTLETMAQLAPTATYKAAPSNRSTDGGALQDQSVRPLVFLNNVSLETAARVHPELEGNEVFEELAVLVSGRSVPLESNQIIGRTVASTWWHHLHLNRPSSVRTVRFFLCVAEQAPQLAFEDVQWSGNWTFASPSQFGRLLECLRLVEEIWPQRHTAFLRLRPDSIVLGPLPDPLLPTRVALYGQVYLAKVGFKEANLLRDEVHCGMCERRCLCESRKYGTVNVRHAADHCAVITDQVFMFPRRVLAGVRRVLANYTDSGPGHFARQRYPPVERGFCIDEGHAVEVGWSRLLEVQGHIPVVPLRLRTTLNRHLQLTKPVWTSHQCIATWSSEQAMSCGGACVPASFMQRTGCHRNFSRRFPPPRFIDGHSLSPLSRTEAHCNQLQRTPEGYPDRKPLEACTAPRFDASRPIHQEHTHVLPKRLALRLRLPPPKTTHKRT